MIDATGLKNAGVQATMMIDSVTLHLIVGLDAVTLAAALN